MKKLLLILLFLASPVFPSTTTCPIRGTWGAATSIFLSYPSQVGLIPNPASDGGYYVQFGTNGWTDDPTDDPLYEIGMATSISGSSLYILRAQLGTTPCVNASAVVHGVISVSTFPPTYTPTVTPTPTITATPTVTPTRTSTPVFTATPTITMTPTITPTPTPWIAVNSVETQTMDLYAKTGKTPVAAKTEVVTTLK